MIFWKEAKEQWHHSITHNNYNRNIFFKGVGHQISTSHRLPKYTGHPTSIYRDAFDCQDIFCTMRIKMVCSNRNLMFYDWSECLMSALGTTKHSSCNCIDTWQQSCIVNGQTRQTRSPAPPTPLFLFCLFDNSFEHCRFILQVLYKGWTGAFWDILSILTGKITLE